jgi:hypothetical protein
MPFLPQKLEKSFPNRRENPKMQVLCTFTFSFQGKKSSRVGRFSPKLAEL